MPRSKATLGALVVENDVPEASAMAYVRYSLASGVSEPVLDQKLSVAPNLFKVQKID